MRQELAFLSHLARLVGNEHEGGYRPGGASTPAPGQPSARPAPSGLDLRA